jgi:fatty acid CoA ligase FadD9
VSEAEQRQHRAALHRAATTRAARRRIAQVLAADPELRAHTSTAEDFAALRDHHSAVELLAAAFARYADRPCLGLRALELDGPAPRLLPRFDTITFGELWRRAMALAAGLADGLVQRGAFVGILGPSGADWVAADLACLWLGATSVPLQTTLSADDLAHVAAETGLATVIVSAGSVGTLEPLVRGGAVTTLVLSDRERVSAARFAALRAEVAAWRPGLRVSTVAELIARELPCPPAAIPGRDGVPAQPLVTLSYTSGSTGRPKGVPYPDARWLQRMREALANAPMPYVIVSYMSLAQIGGRLNLLVSMVSGGLTCFSASADLSTLLDDIRLVRPTTLLLIPRASGLVYQAFQRALLAAGGRLSGPGLFDTPEAQRVMVEMRPGFLGDRLCLVAVGAAPTAPEVIELLERCFEISVLDAYGATELGTVATNGHVRADVEYKLVDVPELGYTSADQPHPRGELWVKSPYVAPGYFKQPEARPFTDGDGFVPSGDVVEERGPRQLRWLDRRNNVLRLAQGEFVSLTRVEEAVVAGGPFVSQVYVHGNPLRAYLLAVLVPDGAALREALTRRGDDPSGPDAQKRLLRAELTRIAAARGLRRHEIPRDFIVETEPFSRENGLLTESDKPRRPALRERYGARLERLYEDIEARQLRDVEALGDASLPLEDKVRRAALAVLGLPDDTDAATSSFVGLGGDSVSAVRLTQVLERACGRAPAVAAVLDPNLGLAQLAARLAPTGGAHFASIHGDAPRLLSADALRLDRFLPEISAARGLPLAGPPQKVLLTGASGFLGRALIEALRRRLPEAELTCLVRGADDAAARERLPHDDRVRVLAGDLSLPRLGLSSERYAALAGSIDVVVHNGALVNHALPYRALYEPNVLGTVEIMRLSTQRRRVPIVFVSSIGVAAGLRRAVREDEPAAGLHARWPLAQPEPHGAGYAASKWACEVLLDQLAAVEVPVTLFRCGLVLPDRGTGRSNHADAISRLLVGLAATSVAPPSFYTEGEGVIDGLPVDLVAAAIAEAAATPRTARYHATAAAGSLDGVVEHMRKAGIVLVRSPSYSAWFAAFRQLLDRLDDVTRRRSPLLLLDRWSAPASPARGPAFDTSAFRALAGGAGFTLDEAYVRAWLRDLGLVEAR